MASYRIPRTDVIDMDSGEKLKRVVSIDVEAGEVLCDYDPPRENLKKLGEVDRFTVRFRSIYPIYAGAFRPYLVHCYGRQN